MTKDAVKALKLAREARRDAFVEVAADAALNASLVGPVFPDWGRADWMLAMATDALALLAGVTEPDEFSNLDALDAALAAYAEARDHEIPEA